MSTHVDSANSEEVALWSYLDDVLHQLKQSQDKLDGICRTKCTAIKNHTCHESSSLNCILNCSRPIFSNLPILYEDQKNNGYSTDKSYDSVASSENEHFNLHYNVSKNSSSSDSSHSMTSSSICSSEPEDTLSVSSSSIEHNFSTTFSDELTSSEAHVPQLTRSFNDIAEQLMLLSWQRDENPLDSGSFSLSNDSLERISDCSSETGYYKPSSDPYPSRRASF